MPDRRAYLHTPEILAERNAERFVLSTRRVVELSGRPAALAVEAPLAPVAGAEGCPQILASVSGAAIPPYLRPG